MGVQQDGRLAGSVEPVGVDDRVAAGLGHLYVLHADRPADRAAMNSAAACSRRREPGCRRCWQFAVVPCTTPSGRPGCRPGIVPGPHSRLRLGLRRAIFISRSRLRDSIVSTRQRTEHIGLPRSGTTKASTARFTITWSRFDSTRSSRETRAARAAPWHDRTRVEELAEPALLENFNGRPRGRPFMSIPMKLRMGWALDWASRSAAPGPACRAFPAFRECRG